MIYDHNNHYNQPYHCVDSSHQSSPLLKYIIIDIKPITSLNWHIFGKCYWKLLTRSSSVKQLLQPTADLYKHVEDAEVEQSADHAQVRGYRPPLIIGNWSIEYPQISNMMYNR